MSKNKKHGPNKTHRVQEAKKHGLQKPTWGAFHHPPVDLF